MGPEPGAHSLDKFVLSSHKPYPGDTSLNQDAAISSSQRRDRLPGPNVRAIYVAKAAAIATILIVMWTLRLFVFDEVPAARYTLIIVLVLLPTSVIACWPGNVPVRLLVLSFVVDVLGVTIGIHFGGGPDNVSGPLLYTIIIGLGGLVLSERAALLAAAGSTLLYGLMVWAEHVKLLPHYLAYAKSPEDAAATVIAVGVYLFVAAWITSYAVRQVRGIYRRAEELRGEAVSALSHDLKSPLGIIDGYAEMIESAEPAQRATYAHAIRRSARQALELVRNMLDAAAIAGKPLVPKNAAVQLNALVAQVLEQYRFAAEGQGVVLTSICAPALPPVVADAQLLDRAIGNLVSNAIKYTGRGGRVEVITARLDRRVQLTVRDTGCGIPAEQLGQLFQKYTRAHSDHPVEGSGLGLYIVQRIVEAHGGVVQVASEVGKGSRFVIELPLTDAR